MPCRALTTNTYTPWYVPPTLILRRTKGREEVRRPVASSVVSEVSAAVLGLSALAGVQRGGLPAHMDGCPKGNPRTIELKWWRHVGHMIFDPLWKDGGPMTYEEARGFVGRTESGRWFCSLQSG